MDVTKTRNGERGAGSGERGTEVWERVGSGNLHKIQYQGSSKVYGIRDQRAARGWDQGSQP